MQHVCCKKSWATCRLTDREGQTCAVCKDECSMFVTENYTALLINSGKYIVWCHWHWMHSLRGLHFSWPPAGADRMALIVEHML
jgi:hypothetical protein